MTPTRTIELLVTGLFLLGSPAMAQSSQPEGGIAWYGSWKQGQSAARRLKRPILLVAAAPHCRSASGMW